MLPPAFDGDTFTTDLQITPSTSGDARSLEFRMRSDDERELRASLNAAALVDDLARGHVDASTANHTVCLSVHVDKTFLELACSNGRVQARSPDAFSPSTIKVASRVRVIGRRLTQD